MLEAPLIAMLLWILGFLTMVFAAGLGWTVPYFVDQADSNPGRNTGYLFLGISVMVGSTSVSLLVLGGTLLSHSSAVAQIIIRHL